MLLNRIANKIFKRNKVIVLVSAHKVGSTWLFNMIKSMENFKSRSLPDRFLETGTLKLNESGIEEILSDNTSNFIYKSHSFPPEISKRGVAKFISIYRDPRDVVVSAVFYLSHLPVERGGYAEPVRSMPVDEQLKHFLINANWCIDRLEAWFNDTATLKIKYESLLTNPLQELKKVTAFLNFTISDNRLQEIITEHSFENKSGRNRGEEDKTSFYRKGIQGDWKNYFNDELKLLFKKSMNNRWQYLLVKMGYETSDNW